MAASYSRGTIFPNSIGIKQVTVGDTNEVVPGRGRVLAFFVGRGVELCLGGIGVYGWKPEVAGLPFLQVSAVTASERFLTVEWS